MDRAATISPCELRILPLPLGTAPRRGGREASISGLSRPPRARPIERQVRVRTGATPTGPSQYPRATPRRPRRRPCYPLIRWAGPLPCGLPPRTLPPCSTVQNGEPDHSLSPGKNRPPPGGVHGNGLARDAAPPAA